MGRQRSHPENRQMKCRVCGGAMEPRVTDLPFKLGDTSIAIVKALPVVQCLQCGETELQDAAMARVDSLLVDDYRLEAGRILLRLKVVLRLKTPEGCPG